MTKKLRLENGSPRRIPRERCRGVHCVDLGESFQTHNCFFSKFGFDTAENEPCKVCPIDDAAGRTLRNEIFQRSGGEQIWVETLSQSLPLQPAAVLEEAVANVCQLVTKPDGSAQTLVGRFDIEPFPEFSAN